MRAATRGEPEAQDLLYRRYAGFVRAAARRLLGPGIRRRYDSVDVQQSVIADLLSDLRAFDFRSRAAFEAWLLACTRNKVTRRAKKCLDRTGRAREMGLADSGSPEPHARGTDAVDSLALREDAARVRAAIATLPATDAAVVRLVVEERRTFADVAAKTGLRSADAARKRYARALNALRRTLTD